MCSEGHKRTCFASFVFEWAAGGHPSITIYKDVDLQAAFENTELAPHMFDAPFIVEDPEKLKQAIADKQSVFAQALAGWEGQFEKPAERKGCSMFCDDEADSWSRCLEVRVVQFVP